MFVNKNSLSAATVVISALHKILYFLFSGNLLKDVETLDLLQFIIERNSMFPMIGDSHIVNFTKMENMAFPSNFLTQ